MLVSASTFCFARFANTEFPFTFLKDSISAIVYGIRWDAINKVSLQLSSLIFCVCVCQQVLNHHSLKKQNKIKLTHFSLSHPQQSLWKSQAEDEVISFAAISKSAKQTNPHHFTVSKKGITHRVKGTLC